MLDFTERIRGMKKYPPAGHDYDKSSNMIVCRDSDTTGIPLPETWKEAMANYNQLIASLGVLRTDAERRVVVHKMRLYEALGCTNSKKSEVVTLAAKIAISHGSTYCGSETVAYFVKRPGQLAIPHVIAAIELYQLKRKFACLRNMRVVMKSEVQQ